MIGNLSFASAMSSSLTRLGAPIRSARDIFPNERGQLGTADLAIILSRLKPAGALPRCMSAQRFARTWGYGILV
jgi:hypothetical protein